MNNFAGKCFVCGVLVDPENKIMNSAVNLPVCSFCKDSNQEKESEQSHLDSLADDLVCGCI